MSPVPDSQEVVDRLQAGLDALRANAATWTKLLGGLLGLFGTAAFVGGLPTIDKLGDDQQTIARLLISAALVFLVFATITSALAERKPVRLLPAQSPDEKQVALQKGQQSVKRLTFWASLAGGLAAVSIIGGSMYLLWLEPNPSPAPPPKVLAVSSETAVCGQLTVENGKETAIEVNGESIAGLTQLVIVSSCPTPLTSPTTPGPPGG